MPQRTVTALVDACDSDTVKTIGRRPTLPSTSAAAEMLITGTLITGGAGRVVFQSEPLAAETTAL
jgi:hypothetical protein